MINYRSFNAQDDYVNELVNLISKAEGQISKAKNIGDGKATIGYGYTFNRSNNLALWVAAGIVLTDAERTALQNIDHAPSGEKTNLALTQFTRSLSKDEARELLKQTYPQYEGAANELGMPISFERAAFVSLTYNRGISAVHTKMQAFYDAVRTGDRAEAWFQIRYNSQTKDPRYVDGIANRRYGESDTFGLYDNDATPTLDDAKQVYRMFALHREDILKYEQQYSPTNINAKSTLISDQLSAASVTLLADLAYNTNPDIANAYAAWEAAGNSAASFIATNLYLSPERSNATQPLDPNHAARIDARQYKNGVEIASDDILIGGSGGDRLIGGKGNDLLIGGAGDDVLEGGGNDIMAGGEGNDTYILSGGESYTLEDKQGSNRILFNGNYLYSLVTQTDGSIKSPDGLFTAAWKGTDLEVTDVATGNKVTLNKNFQSGDFGITLNDESAAPTNTVIGTPDNADKLIGKESNDIIEGLGGNDVLAGFEGDDYLYSDTKITVRQAIINGNIDAGTGLKGEWLMGMTGNDTLISGAGNDVLLGGGGQDLLIAGAGDDEILGDIGYWPLSFNWTVIDIPPNGRAFGQAIGGQEPPDAAADIIYAGGGGDHVWGGVGNDVIYGEGGNDSLYGNDDSDIVMGGAGDDIITGDGVAVTGQLLVNEGNDYIDGGDGNDHAWGNGGNDTVMGGGGDDMLVGDNGDGTGTQGEDYLDGGDGNDILYGEGGNNTLIGGVGDDQLYSGNYLDGGDGNDSLSTTGTDSILFGGQGDDSLTATGGNSYLDGEDGNNILIAEGGYNSLFTGAGNDTLSAAGGHSYLDAGDGINSLIVDGGDNTLFAGIGDDYLSARGGRNSLFADGGNNKLVVDQGGNNTLVAGDGNDYLSAKDGNNILDGGEGDNTLIAEGGFNILFGGAGNDLLSAADGFNNLDAGAGNDRLIANAGFNTLSGGWGDDSLSSAGGASSLDGGDGNDALVADMGHNALSGGAGDDYLSAVGGDSILDGGDGNDTLIADMGNNTLLGGTGDDILIAKGGNSYLDGGEGCDWYVFDAGFGINHIVDSGTGGNGIQFNFNFAGSGVTIGLGSLKLSFANGDELHIDNFDPNNPLNSSSIDTFVFADRTLSLQEVIDIRMDVIGTPNTDFIQGTGMNERIFALAEDDTILAGGGSDTIDAGAGNDTLDGGIGSDIMIGSQGNDTYVIDNAGDVVTEKPDEGIDLVQSGISYILTDNVENLVLTGSGQLNGTGNALANTITGNSGDNALNGGLGADRLVGGLGNDSYVVDNIADMVIERASEGTDTVYASVDYSLSDNAEILSLTGAANIKAIGNSLDNNLFGNDADNTLSGLAGNDIVIGGAGDDNLLGGAGDDWLYGEGGAITESNDTLEGGDGNDQLWGNGGNDFANGGNGNDQLWGNSGGDTLSGGAGNDIISGDNGNGIGAQGNDYLDGGDGNDTLNGEGGDDTLLGGAGNDSLDGGIGIDSVSGGLGNDRVWGGDGHDTIMGEAGDDRLSGDNGDSTGMQGNDIIDGGDGNDSIWGNGGGDTLQGSIGDDYLEGQDGNDTLYGQTGDDDLWGDEGNDSLDGGDGADYLGGGNNDDNLLGGAGDDIVTGDNGDGTGIEGRDTIDGGAGNDKLWGDGGSDSLVGGDGNDRLWGDVGDGSGAEGKDFLDGGNGDDKLWGEGGNDTLLGGADDDILNGDGTGAVGDDYLDGGIGNDTLYGEEGNDTLIGGAGVNYLEGGAGNDILIADIGSNTVLGGAGDDTLVAKGGSNYLDGGEGRDWYVFDVGFGSSHIADSGTGSNGIQFNFNFADSGITLGLGSLKLNFANDDELHIDNFNPYDPLNSNSIDTFVFADRTLNLQDVLDLGMDVTGTGNAEAIQGTAMNERIQALAGDDVVYSGAGNDTLSGGQGNDTLYGGSGNDRYEFVLGDGADSINDAQGNNTLFIGGKLTTDNLEASRVGDNMSIKIAGTADSILLSNWFTQTEGVNRLEFDNGSWLGRAGMEGLMNRPPVAAPDAITVYEDAGVTDLPSSALLANDTDPDANDVVSIIAVGSSSLGANVQLVNGHVQYDIGNRFQELGAGQTIIDSFSYTVSDSKGKTASSVVNVTIVGTNDAPVTAADTAAVQEDDHTVIAGNVLANDTDVDQDSVLTVATAGVYNCNYGSLNLAKDGSYSYFLNNSSPAVQALAAGQIVTETFTYQVSDGVSATPTILTATIAGTNDAPVAVVDVASVREDLNIAAIGNVLANDTDIDQGSVLSVANIGVFIGSYGNLSLAADGSYNYTLNNTSLAVQSLAAGQIATETFTYQATDGLLVTSSPLTITITGNNDAPTVATPLVDQTVTEAGAFSYQLPADAFTDYDAGDLLSYSTALSNGNPLPDWLVFDSRSRTFTSTLPNGSAGLWDISVTATDTAGDSAVDVFRLDVANLVQGSGKADKLNGTALKDVMFGFAGDDWLRGTDSADILNGGSGNDVLDGGNGDDLLVGDTLESSTSTNTTVNDEADHRHNSNKNAHESEHSNRDLLSGGTGNDTLMGGSGEDLLIGGAGNDTIDTGSGADIIAFKRGDGQDTVLASSGADNVLLLSGGLKVGDLHFRHLGNDLVLEIGELGQNQDQITFRDWYASLDKHSIGNLQLIDSMEVKGNKIRIYRYDFGKLVESFDQAVAADSSTDHWTVTRTKQDNHLEQHKGESGDLISLYGKDSLVSAFSSEISKNVLDSFFF